ncbi:MAG TPA: DNA cytosine methyltransferase [Kiloniellaceae bacterium]|nr:DNA cytosine methyltransferase [Kiloniellaceae bacterium]
MKYDSALRERADKLVEWPVDDWTPAPVQPTALAVAGSFAGIGGIEEGFRRAGHHAELLAENDDAASAVLEGNFPNARLIGDVRQLSEVLRVDVLTAGFPCQDLSQVGRCAGIDGPNSGLVSHVFELLAKPGCQVRWLVLENVPFMLKLDRGRAIALLAARLEAMGWSWAYRIIDARCFGLPQRRRRVILVASRDADPRPAVLGVDAERPAPKKRGQHACGFYWTEGNSGIGWAVDAIPPLKGGSGVSIPSAPAIWFPRRGAIGTPTIEDAERLQGFEPGWTAAAMGAERGQRRRWRLVGNAVSAPVAEWVARRLTDTHSRYDDAGDVPLVDGMKWPDAAWGHDGMRGVSQASDWPERRDQLHLAGFLNGKILPLTHKAAAGFWMRLQRSGLRYDADFGDALDAHVRRMAETG